MKIPGQNKIKFTLGLKLVASYLLLAIFAAGFVLWK
jgi:hypothetical protein